MSKADIVLSSEVKSPDVRLVIDVSGSMKRNDPSNLRQPAVSLLMELLPEGSRSGVWTFGKYVNMLVPHKPVTDNWKRAAKNKATDINSVGLYTNIGEALERAAYDIDKINENFKPSIILLTDGMVDISKDPELNKKERERILNKVLPKLVNAGITVHTIALSDNADKFLLDRLSLDTDGISDTAYTADDLMRIFLQAFDASAPSQQVPFDGQSFVVDSSVEEFTALFFHDGNSIILIEPDKTEHSSNTSDANVNWYASNRYDLITVSRPLEGEWTIKGESAAGSRVTVVSNLNLRVKPLKQNIPVAEPQDLDFVFEEEGRVVKRAEFLELVDFKASVSKGLNKREAKNVWSEKIHNTPPPKSGRYHHVIPSLTDPGVYYLSVFADGKSFTREFTHRFEVRSPYTVEFISNTNDSGEKEYFVIVRHQQRTDPNRKARVSASITTPDRRQKILTFVLVDGDRWQARVTPDKVGTYTIKATVLDTTSGETTKIHLDPISFEYHPDADFESLVSSSNTPDDDEKSSEIKDERPAETDTAEEPVEASADSKDAEKELGDEKAEGDTDNAEEVSAEEAGGEEESSLADILLYALLGAVNLLGLGAGYILYKKMFGSTGGEEIPDTEIPGLEEIDINEDPVVAEGEASELDGAEMTMVDSIDEVPPMEDLDAELDLEDVSEDSVAQTTIDEVVDTDDLDLDFGLDDMDADDTVVAEDVQNDSQVDEPPTAEMNDAEEDPTDDMVEEMLKAEGLDLAEEDLDDAISNLIDELDNEGFDDDL